MMHKVIFLMLLITMLLLSALSCQTKPSVIVHDGNIYCVKDVKYFIILDPATGEEKIRMNLEE